MRSTRRIVAAAAVVALGAVAYWFGGISLPQFHDGPRSAAPAPPECEIEGYPCTWAEVPPEVAARTDQVGQIAAALLHAVQDPYAVAEVLAGSDELAEIDADVLAVRFRLHGGRPAFVSLPHDHGDPERGEDVEGAAVVPQPSVSERVPPGEPRGRGASWAAAGLAAVFPTLHAQTNGAGINTATPGSGKKALLLASFYYELGKETVTLNGLFSQARDYRAANGGRVDFFANMKQDGEANDAAAAAQLGVQGQATIAHFANWREYNFIYVATHGLSYCPDFPGEDPDQDALVRRRPVNPKRDQEIAGGKCHTLIFVQVHPRDTRGWQQTIAEQGYLNLPGVDPHYKTAHRSHPGLTEAEARACLELSKKDSSARTPSGGKPCLQPLEIPTEVILSTQFFREQYRGGFNNTVIFLAACEALKVGDLFDVLAPQGNRNVAVFGYTQLVGDYVANPMGELAATLFLDDKAGGFDSRKILEALKAETVELMKTRESNVRGDGRPGDFAGVVRSPGARVHDGSVGDGRLEEASSNPTHARDIVLLVDPMTGEELEHGGTVAVAHASTGTPRGGGDRLSVHPQLIGVASANAPPTVGLQVRVVGEAVPGEHYVPDQPIGESAFRYVETVALGRAHSPGEVVDLEVRADLPGGGHTRWVYRDIRLMACYWRGDVSGHVSRQIGGHGVSLGRTALPGGALGGPGTISSITLGQTSTVRTGAVTTPASPADSMTFFLAGEIAEHDFRFEESPSGHQAWIGLAGTPLFRPNVNRGQLRITLHEPQRLVVGGFAVAYKGTTIPDFEPAALEIRGTFVWTPACPTVWDELNDLGQRTADLLRDRGIE